MNSKTDLSEKMIARADEDGLPDGHILRVMAKEFDEATEGYFAESPTVTSKQFLGAFARAELCWCEYSGDPLLDTAATR